MEDEEKIVLRIELTKSQYLALEALAEKKGYNLASDFVRALIAEVLSGGEHEVEVPRSPLDIKELSELIAKRLERRIEDILNPYTGKIDEIYRRLGEVIELLEAREDQEQRREEYVERPRSYERYERQQRQKRPSAIDRLKEQKVVFYSDVAWMKAPNRLFQKLEREGAIVISGAGETVGVDPEYWEEFVNLVSRLGISDPDEVEKLLTTKLGEQARRLFQVLLRSGLAYYDRDLGSWVVRIPSRSQRGPASG
ncbi:MAG: hypothetical protein F7C38_01905 [Desulfurococcales archaeon]|nr:hypothetical protein [Desulfurococcales archaeon]